MALLHSNEVVWRQLHLTGRSRLDDDSILGALLKRVLTLDVVNQILILWVCRPVRPKVPDNQFLRGGGQKKVHRFRLLNIPGWLALRVHVPLH